MFEYFLGGLCISAATLYSISNAHQKKLKIYNAKFMITYIIFSFLIGINYKYSKDVIKFIISTVIILSVNKILFKKEMKNTVLSLIATEVIAIIAELIFGILVLSFTQITNNDVVIDIYFGALITNIFIATFMIVMTIFNLPFKIYIKINQKTEKINDKQIFLIASLLVATVNVLFSSIYYEMPLIVLMIINIIIMIVYGYIVLKITNEKNENLKIFEKYKKTADSLNEYHDVVNRYRVNNHENRNQLQTIERMAKTSGNESIEKYVQALLEKNEQDQTKIKFEQIVIPDSWLKTTLYAKLETIVKNNIKYILDIDRTVKTSDLIEIDEYTMLDICNILNIFLDNAIEAVLNNPTWKIKIRFYKEQNMIIISVSNPIYKELNIKKIDEKGYTSKGKGRGYGLAFVKETVRNNKKLINEKRISNGIFVQFLKIKI